jgi:phosphoserine phosphatase RsbU/P
VAFFLTGQARARLERRNRELERQITIGDLKLQAHEAELKAAHEIQAHLLPHELPQMQPFQIACAWEPARSVGGDYFDVLTLGPDRLGICIADVSGKGITAALLMANLQAAVRAFAPVSSGSAVRQPQRSAVRKHCSRKVRDPLLWDDRQGAADSAF